MLLGEPGRWYSSNAAVRPGYYISERAVHPVAAHRLADPSSKVGEGGVELRVVGNLWPLAEAVVGSPVAFSCIRMRNSVPLGSVTNNPSIKGTSCGKPQDVRYVELQGLPVRQAVLCPGYAP